MLGEATPMTEARGGDPSDLIERLESAAGPDRDLDGDIAVSMGLFARRPVVAQALRYTESIDAALTLMPARWEWALFCQGGTFRVEAGDPSIGLEGESEHGAAIAICIAALKAREPR